jgi:hypothetical protein
VNCESVRKRGKRSGDGQDRDESTWEVESKNMAALDNGREKFDPITRKIVGTTDQQQVAVKRLDIREIMGVKIMREIARKMDIPAGTILAHAKPSRLNPTDSGRNGE